VRDVAHEFDDCPAKPRIEALEEKDRVQNGCVQRIEQKIDRLMFATMGGLGLVILALVGAIAGGLFR
jgi:hypothetical protein